MSIELADSPTPAERVDDLAQIIRAYNQVTENLRASHETLRAEVVRLQEALASRDAQLQRSRRLAALGEMAAGIAHEIRNPLAAIRLFAEVLVQDLDDVGVDPAVAATAGKIAHAVMGLDGIVDDVLAFAREMTLKTVDVEVEPVLEKALAAVRAAQSWPDITVRRPEDADPRLSVHADPVLLHQALSNLIRNAVDAMAASGGTLFLGAQASPEAVDQVVLTVRDTGPGIGEEAIDRIFNPFFTTRSTGTGLGLAIVHRIVDAHGGSISVHNDGGAVFELRLPIALADRRRADREGDAARTACAAGRA